MEYLLPSEVARLVYGYLDTEKCEEAAHVFLRSSEHLKECYQAYLRNRKFSTKVNGFTLMKCLDQLFAVRRLVQDRLAALQENNISCHELVDQVAYLLDVGCKGHSTVMFNITVPTQDTVNRTIDESIVAANQTPTNFKTSKDGSDIMSYSVSMEGSPSQPTWCIANITPPQLTPPPSLSLPPPAPSPISPIIIEKKITAPETTSLSSLPGTVRSQRKSSKNRRKEPVPVEKVIKKALQDEKLHEKIADNINKVIFTPEKFNPEKEKESSGGDELESVIQTIVNQTQEDPYFENFLDEFFEGVAKNDALNDEDTDEELKSKKKVNEAGKKLMKDSSRKTKCKRSKNENVKNGDSNIVDTSKKLAIVKPNKPRSDCPPFECSNEFSTNKAKSMPTSSPSLPLCTNDEPSQSTNLKKLLTVSSNAQFQEISSSQQNVSSIQTQSHTTFSSPSAMSHQSFSVFDKKPSIYPNETLVPNFSHSFPPSVSVPSRLPSTAAKQNLSKIIVLPSASDLPATPIMRIASTPQSVATIPNLIVPRLPATQIMNERIASTTQSVATIPNQIVPRLLKTGTVCPAVTSVPEHNQFPLTLPKSAKNNNFSRVYIAEDNHSEPKYGIYTKDVKPGIVFSTVSPSSDFINIAPKGALKSHMSENLSDEEHSEKMTKKSSKVCAKKRGKPVVRHIAETSEDTEKKKKKRGVQKNSGSSLKSEVKTEDTKFISLNQTLEKSTAANKFIKVENSSVSTVSSSDPLFSPVKIEAPDNLIEKYDSPSDSQNLGTPVNSLVRNKTIISQDMSASFHECCSKPVSISCIINNPAEMDVDSTSAKVFVKNESCVLNTGLGTYKEVSKPIASEIIPALTKTNANQRLCCSGRIPAETYSLVPEQNVVSCRTSPKFSNNTSCVTCSEFPVSSSARFVSPEAATLHSSQSSEHRCNSTLSNPSVRKPLKRTNSSLKNDFNLPLNAESHDDDSEQIPEIEPVKKKMKKSEPRENHGEISTSSQRGSFGIQTDTKVKAENVSEDASSTSSYPQNEGGVSFLEQPNKCAEIVPMNSSKEAPKNQSNVNRICLSSNKMLSLKKFVSPIDQSRTKKLSSSTPRNKRNHVRALDFSTPPSLKGVSQRHAVTSPKLTSGGRSAASERFRNVCRSRLFESPFVKSISSTSKPLAASTLEENNLAVKTANVSSKVTTFESLENNISENFDLEKSCPKISTENSLPHEDTQAQNTLDSGLALVSPEKKLSENLIVKAPETYQSQEADTPIFPKDDLKNLSPPKQKGSRSRHLNDQSVRSYSITKSNYFKVVKKVTRKTVKSKNIGIIGKLKSTKSNRREEVMHSKKKSISSKQICNLSQHRRKNKFVRGGKDSVSPTTSKIPEERNFDLSPIAEIDPQPSQKSPQASLKSIAGQSTDFTFSLTSENNLISSSRNEIEATEVSSEVINCSPHKQSSPKIVQMNDEKGIAIDHATDMRTSDLRKGQTASEAISSLEKLPPSFPTNSSKCSILNLKSSPNDKMLHESLTSGTPKDELSDSPVPNEKMSILETVLRGAGAPGSSSNQDDSEVYTCKSTDAFKSVKSETENNIFFQAPGNANPRGIINSTFFENDESSVKFKINRNLELERREHLLTPLNHALISDDLKLHPGPETLEEKLTNKSGATLLPKVGRANKTGLSQIIQLKESFASENERKYLDSRLSKSGLKKMRSQDQLVMNSKLESEETDDSHSNIAELRLVPGIQTSKSGPVKKISLDNVSAATDVKRLTENYSIIQRSLPVCTKTNGSLNKDTISIAEKTSVDSASRLNDKAKPPIFDLSDKPINNQINSLVLNTKENDSVHSYHEPDESMTNLEESCLSEDNLLIITMEEEQGTMNETGIKEELIPNEENCDKAEKLKCATNCAADQSKSLLVCKRESLKTNIDKSMSGSNEKEKLHGFDKFDGEEVMNSDRALKTYNSESNQFFVRVHHDDIRCNKSNNSSRYNKKEFLRRSAFLEDYSSELEIEEENGDLSVCKLAVSKEEILLHIPSKVRNNAHLNHQSKAIKKKKIVSLKKSLVCSDHLEEGKILSSESFSTVGKNLHSLESLTDQVTSDAVRNEQNAEIPSHSAKLGPKTGTDGTISKDAVCLSKKLSASSNSTVPENIKAISIPNRNKPGCAISDLVTKITQIGVKSDRTEVDESLSQNGSQNYSRSFDALMKFSGKESDFDGKLSSSEISWNKNAQFMEPSQIHLSSKLRGVDEKTSLPESKINIRSPETHKKLREETPIIETHFYGDYGGRKTSDQTFETFKIEVSSECRKGADSQGSSETKNCSKIHQSSTKALEMKPKNERMCSCKNTQIIESPSSKKSSRLKKIDVIPSAIESKNCQKTPKIKQSCDEKICTSPTSLLSPQLTKSASFSEKKKSLRVTSPTDTKKQEHDSSSEIKLPAVCATENPNRTSNDKTQRDCNYRDRTEGKSSSKSSVTSVKSSEMKHEFDRKLTVNRTSASFSEMKKSLLGSSLIDAKKQEHDSSSEIKRPTVCATENPNQTSNDKTQRDCNLYAADRERTEGRSSSKSSVTPVKSSGMKHEFDRKLSVNRNSPKSASVSEGKSLSKSYVTPVKSSGMKHEFDRKFSVNRDSPKSASVSEKGKLSISSTNQSKKHERVVDKESKSFSVGLSSNSSENLRRRTAVESDSRSKKSKDRHKQIGEERNDQEEKLKRHGIPKKSKSVTNIVKPTHDRIDRSELEEFLKLRAMMLKNNST